MRNIVVAIVIGLGALALGLALALCIAGAQPQAPQARNAYWPLSVEVQVRDK